MNPSCPFTLLVVDPQTDFISGSLAVTGGAAAMDWLSDFIRNKADEIERVVVTMDQHPADHCSFIEQGGDWPAHCVRYTAGAAIYPPLFAALELLRRRGIGIDFIEKATAPDSDVYSAFGREAPDALSKADRIAVAGIAGDYCVRRSVEDLCRHGLQDRLFLLEDGIAYINKG